MNEEIMEMEQVTEETQPEMIEEEQGGIGTLAAMAIGGLLTAAGFAAVKGGRKVWAKLKAKRNAAKIEDGDTEVIDAEIVESDDDTDE